MTLRHRAATAPSAVLAILLALSGCHGPPSAPDPGSPGYVLAIRGATVLDGRRGARPDVTIVVEGSRITHVGPEPTALPEGARTLDGTGRFVVPGLIDVHVHDAADAYLRRMLAWGVTSVQLMPRSPPHEPVGIERASHAAGTPTPRLQLTPMFAAEFPDNLVPDTYEFLKPATADEARQAVRDVHARGYRQIKIIQDDSTLWAGAARRSRTIPEPVFEALVEEARSHGMRVYVHATQLDVTRAAAEAGVDAFLHGTMDEELAESDWRLVRRAGTAWVPTFNALLLFGDQRRHARRLLADPAFSEASRGEALAERRARASADAPIVPPPMETLVDRTDAYVETIARNTRQALDAGVPVAVGSDGGPAGLSTHLELELLQEAGMTPSEVLGAATRGGAVAMGWQEDVGSVEVGKLADLVVLDADPRADARNGRRIVWVIKAGRPYRPTALRTINGRGG